MSPSRWIKNSDLKNRNETLLHVLCLCVCVISEIASILIDLNCAGTIGTGAPESPSTQRRWNVNMFQSLIGLQTTGPLLVRSEQLLLPWWDVRVNCVYVHQRVWLEPRPAAGRTHRKLWLESERRLRLGLTMPSNNLNSRWFGFWQQTNVYSSLYIIRVKPWRRAFKTVTMFLNRDEWKWLHGCVMCNWKWLKNLWNKF